VDVRGGELPYSNDDFGGEELVAEADELLGTSMEGYWSTGRGGMEMGTACGTAVGAVGETVCLGGGDLSAEDGLGGGDLASMARKLSILSMID
jgi:hypothetical protein